MSDTPHWSTTLGNVLPAVGGAISAIGNIGQGKKNRNLQREINQKNIDYQTAENQRNRQFAIDQWNAQNAYNDPAAMMARAEKAGINKWLVASGGAGTTTASPVSTPSTSAPQEQHYDYGPTAGQSIGNAIGSFSPLFLQMQQMLSTRANTDADTYFKQENTRLTEQKTAYQQYQNQIAAIDAANYPEWKANQLKQQEYETFKAGNEAYQSGITSEFLVPQLTAQLGLTEANARKIDNDIQLGWENLDVSRKNAETSRMATLNSIRVSNEQIKAIRATVRQIHANTAKIIVDTGISRNNVDKASYEMLIIKEKYENYVRNGGKESDAAAEMAQSALNIYKKYADDQARANLNLTKVKQFQGIVSGISQAKDVVSPRKPTTIYNVK